MKLESSRSGIIRPLLKVIKSLPNSNQQQLALANVLWQKVTGPLIGRNSWVEQMNSEGVLTVCIDSRAWLKPLKSSQRYIIDQINQMGYLKRPVIHFEVRDCSRKTLADEPNRAPVQPEPHVEEAILTEITDPKLQEIVLRAFRGYRRNPDFHSG